MPPGMPAEGMPIGFHVLHIRTPDGSLLVDAGFDEPNSEWGQSFAREWSGVERTAGLTSGLEMIGESPESIRQLVLTHVHFDHVAGLTVERDGALVPRFPQAEVFVGRDDWEHPQEEDEAAPDIHQRLDIIQRVGLLTLVDGELELLPGVTIVPAAGESPGHSVVRVRSEGQTFFALGDLFHSGFEIENADCMPPWADRQAMTEARGRVLDEAALSGATVVFTHHPFPPWGRIVPAADGYDWEAG